jgi:hypothetical protein
VFEKLVTFVTNNNNNTRGQGAVGSVGTATLRLQDLRDVVALLSERLGGRTAWFNVAVLIQFSFRRKIVRRIAKTLKNNE